MTGRLRRAHRCRPGRESRRVLPHVFERFRQADGSPKGARRPRARLDVVRQSSSSTAARFGRERGRTAGRHFPVNCRSRPVSAPPEKARAGRRGARGASGRTDRTSGGGASRGEASPTRARCSRVWLRGRRCEGNSAAAASKHSADALNVLVSETHARRNGFHLIGRVRRSAEGGAKPAVALTATRRGGPKALASAALRQHHKPVEPAELVATSRARREGGCRARRRAIYLGTPSGPVGEGHAKSKKGSGDARAC